MLLELGFWMKAKAEKLWVLCACVTVVLVAVGLPGCVHQDKSDRASDNTARSVEAQNEILVAAPIASANEDEAAEEEPEWADNSYCYVCHLNYDGEELTQNHEIAGVGCETCHGVSEQHSADEDGITPPERMFSKNEIHSFCTTCHTKAEIEHVDEHKPLFQKGSGDTHVCTDCHGDHEMAVRTRIWDKKTGELVSDDGVRMMYKDSPTRGNP